MPLGGGLYKNFLRHHEEREKIHIIDGHSHFGKDNFWLNYGDFNEYIKHSNYVKEVFAMSVPCPIIEKEDGTKTILSYYEIVDREFKHYKVDEKDGKKIYTPNLLGANPYKEANDYIYNLCKQNHDIKFNYVPIIHPYYYSYDDMLEHINHGAKMFKIHGVACGVIPKKINEEFFMILEQLKIPVIIHTDFNKEENILSYNNTLNWLQCLKKYNIKVYFAHAARLSENAIDIINDDDRYVVGIGPDKMLSINGLNEHNIKNYLEYCFLRFNIDKLIFDIDYPWNINGIENYTFDWNSIYSLEQLDLTYDEKDKVMSKNIKNFIKER